MLTLSPQLIRSTWDLKRFLDRGQGAGPPADAELAGAPAADNAVLEDKYADVGSVATSVNEALCSDYFWAFLEMIQALNGVLGHLTNWCQGCPCHSVRTKSVHRAFTPDMCAVQHARTSLPTAI